MSVCFRIDSVVRKECIMSSWLFNVYIDAVIKGGKSGDFLASFRKRKDRKTWKSRSEEKMVGLAQPPYSPQGN